MELRVDLPQLRTIVSDGFSFMYVSSAVFKSGKLRVVLTLDMPKTENAILDKGFRLVGKACQYWGNASDVSFLCRCGEDGCLFPQHRGIESCLVCLCDHGCIPLSLFLLSFFIFAPFSSHSYIHGSPLPSLEQRRRTHFVRPIKSHLLEAPSFPPQSHYFIDLITEKEE